jgi:hypothetical protein
VAIYYSRRSLFWLVLQGYSLLVDINLETLKGIVLMDLKDSGRLWLAGLSVETGASPLFVPPTQVKIFARLLKIINNT